ncbi:MAG: hypothetical protein ACRC6I_01965, partial [Paracoccaceae bacterium]
MRFALLFALLSPVSAFAAPTVYICDVNTNGRDGFQSQVVIAHDVAERFVSVNDALIQGVTGGPLLGEVATDNGTRIVFKWTVPNVPNNTGQNASLSYRATIFKADG